MAGSTRMQGPQWLTLGGHFAILLVTLQLESAAAWPYALLAMAGVSFFGWLGNYRRYRQIHDLPTSRVASAAQGYVELLGVAVALDGTPVISPLGAVTCCWYHYITEEQDDNDNFRKVDEGSSVAHFLLVDDSGQCVVSPDGAEIITTDHRVWREGRMRYNEWVLRPRSTLYALGEFSTHGQHVGTAADDRAEAGALLADWKRDTAQLLRRFDLDQDGRIDLREWELARLQAAREVRQRRSEQSSRFVDGVHLLRKPRDGRLFLLANEMPESLGRRFSNWSLFHLLFFCVAGTAGLVLAVK